MTERVTKNDFNSVARFNGENTEAAKITALGLLAVAQAIDGLTHQLKRVVDTELPPEDVVEKKPKFSRDC